MLRVGLTGGIGSGKTIVAQIFEVLGIPVYYADLETKRIMNENKILRKQLLEHFGEQTFVNDKLNRPYLASIVFNNPEKLDLLNALTHPLTIQHATEWMQTQTTNYVIKEAALIFESGSAENLDYVIGVSAPRALRIQRVMNRDGITRDEVVKRLTSPFADTIVNECTNPGIAGRSLPEPWVPVAMTPANV